MNPLYKDIAERALSTFVQSFIAVIGTAQVTSIDANLIETAVVAGIASAASIVKSGLASKAPLGSDSASLVD